MRSSRTRPDGGLGSGAILRAMFGYTSTPEWITFIAWLTYVVGRADLYLRPVRPRARNATREQTASGPDARTATQTPVRCPPGGVRVQTGIAMNPSI